MGWLRNYLLIIYFSNNEYYVKLGDLNIPIQDKRTEGKEHIANLGSVSVIWFSSSEKSVGRMEPITRSSGVYIIYAWFPLSFVWLLCSPELSLSLLTTSCLAQVLSGLPGLL